MNYGDVSKQSIHLTRQALSQSFRVSVALDTYEEYSKNLGIDQSTSDILRKTPLQMDQELMPQCGSSIDSHQQRERIQAMEKCEYVFIPQRYSKNKLRQKRVLRQENTSMEVLYHIIKQYPIAPRKNRVLTTLVKE